ncbi:MAG: hypothetical protein KDA76_19430 [Planctomycetaceae bacterium]|nr:hypothetical protein [Planctomycetaceae bacterium]
MISAWPPGTAYELRDSDGNGFYETLVINTHDPGGFGMSQRATTSTVAERLSQGIWDNRITSQFVGRPLEDPIAEGMAAAWDEMAHRSSRGVVGMGNGAIGGGSSGAIVGGAIGMSAGPLGAAAGAVVGGLVGGLTGAFTGFLHGYSNPGMSDAQLKHESLGLGIASGFSAAPVIANSIASSARVVTIGATGKGAAGGISGPRQFGPKSIGAAQTPDPKVLQTGGHTITNRTRQALGLTQDEAKRAMEGLKRDLGQGASHHQHKILDNGDVLDSHTGDFLGNLYDYLF